MIDVGFWEVAMIGVLALIILGPERLPSVARTAGAWMGKARRMMNDIKTDIKSELNEEDLDQLKNIRDDIQQAGEGFKSQIESSQENLQKEGSEMDTAIASALNKGTSGATKADDAASTGKKTTRKKATKKKTGTKKVAKKKTSKKKADTKQVAKKTSRKKVSKKVAKKTASTPKTEKSS